MPFRINGENSNIYNVSTGSSNRRPNEDTSIFNDEPANTTNNVVPQSDNDFTTKTLPPDKFTAPAGYEETVKTALGGKDIDSFMKNLDAILIDDPEYTKLTDIDEKNIYKLKYAAKTMADYQKNNPDSGNETAFGETLFRAAAKMSYDQDQNVWNSKFSKYLRGMEIGKNKIGFSGSSPIVDDKTEHQMEHFILGFSISLDVFNNKVPNPVGVKDQAMYAGGLIHEFEGYILNPLNPLEGGASYEDLLSSEIAVNAASMVSSGKLNPYDMAKRYMEIQDMNPKALDTAEKVDVMKDAFNRTEAIQSKINLPLAHSKEEIAASKSIFLNNN